MRGILEVPGVSDESSQCLLFMLGDVAVLLPQFEVGALLLSVKLTKICPIKIWFILRL